MRCKGGTKDSCTDIGIRHWHRDIEMDCQQNFEDDLVLRLHGLVKRDIKLIC